MKKLVTVEVKKERERERRWYASYRDVARNVRPIDRRMWHNYSVYNHNGLANCSLWRPQSYQDLLLQTRGPDESTFTSVLHTFNRLLSHFSLRSLYQYISKCTKVKQNKSAVWKLFLYSLQPLWLQQYCNLRICKV